MVLKAKLYQIFLSFRFFTHYLLRVVRTCPGHHPQPIDRNRVFEIERTEPPPLKHLVTIIYANPSLYILYHVTAFIYSPISHSFNARELVVFHITVLFFETNIMSRCHRTMIMK